MFTVFTSLLRSSLSRCKLSLMPALLERYVYVNIHSKVLHSIVVNSLVVMIYDI